MKTGPIILFVFIACFLAACRHDGRKDMQDMSYEKIDFFSFKELQVKSIPSEIVKSRKYIKIEGVSNESLFGRIDKIEIIGNKIYILDRRIKSLTLFSPEGKFIGKVGKAGQGPHEYVQITDFDEDADGNVHILDDVTKRINIYNKDLEFLQSKKVPFDADIIHCLSDGNLMFGLASWNKGNNAGEKVVVTDKNLNTLHSYMRYDEYVDDGYWVSKYRFVNADDYILYSRPIDNAVCLFSKSGVPSKSYQFDFGHKNVPDEDKKEIERKLAKYDNYCVLKEFVVTTDAYIAGTLWYGRKSRVFIVNRKTNDLYLLEATADNDFSNFAGYSGKTFISFIYPGKYDDLERTDLPDDVKEHLRKENFVLCLYELR